MQRVPEYGLKKSSTVIIRVKLSDFLLQYFANLSVSTNPSQGIYSGIKAALLVP